MNKVRHPRAVSVAIAALLVSTLVASCIADGRSQATAPAVSGLDVPSDPYPSFPYASALQRRSFNAYLTCARSLGVDMEGPYADSRGHGVLFRLAPGTHPPANAQRRVNRLCPQGDVGIALTPSPAGHATAFERALRKFARCMSAHGVADLPAPAFGSSEDPWHSLRWPLDWHAPGVVHAAKQCVGVLRDYMFGG